MPITADEDTGIKATNPMYSLIFPLPEIKRRGRPKKNVVPVINVAIADAEYYDIFSIKTNYDDVTDQFNVDDTDCSTEGATDCSYEHIEVGDLLFVNTDESATYVDEIFLSSRFAFLQSVRRVCYLSRNVGELPLI